MSEIKLPEAYGVDGEGNVYRIVGLPDYKPELPEELKQITEKQWKDWHKKAKNEQLRKNN